MTENSGFSGFPKEGFDFLKGLAGNNERDWFQGHKDEYLELIQEPAKAFVTELGSRLQELSPGFIHDTRTNGSGSIMRIYRDIRFKKDKTPYNTNVRMIFWEGVGKKTECPGFFFCFDPKGGQLYSGMHIFPKPMLGTFRDAVIDEDFGPELEEAIVQVISQGGGKGGIGYNSGSGSGTGHNSGGGRGIYQIGGDQYKRVPKEYDPLHDRAYLLKYKGLWAAAPPIASKDILSPKLVDIVYDHCKNMYPIHNWLAKTHTLSREVGV